MLTRDQLQWLEIGFDENAGGDDAGILLGKTYAEMEVVFNQRMGTNLSAEGLRYHVRNLGKKGLSRGRRPYRPESHKWIGILGHLLLAVTDTLHSLVKFYVAFQVKEQKTFIPTGEGMYRSMTAADISDVELEESAIDAGDETAAEFDGWLYAFSFPVLVKPEGPFPIKVGKTIGNVEDRVIAQCKGSATFDNPVILGRWPVKRVGPAELAVHNVLKVRGKWARECTRNGMVRHNHPGNTVDYRVLFRELDAPSPLVSSICIHR